MGSDARTALVTGATGFIGGRLANALADHGWQVRALVRDRGRVGELAERGIELVEGNVLDAESLRGAGDGVEVAYYLVHGMGRGGEGDFEEREREAARNFAEMAKREGVERVVYLGGLGDQPRSKHLRSRAQTAEILRQLAPPLTYFRAAMVVGARSESYRTLRYLVQRLPAMIAPSWLSTPTQPIAVDDVIAYLKKAPDLPESTGREIQIGGPDVLSYGDMLDRMAHALRTNPRPRVPVPLLTPWLSSLWIGLVTPVDAGVARPLIEGLSTPTTVTDPSGAEPFGIEPVSFAEALRRALAEDSEVKIPMSAELRLYSDRLSKVPRTGAVESVQEAELRLDELASSVVNRGFLERAARAYWRLITRWTLGLIRVTSDGGEQCVVLIARPFVLLRFHAPEYEVSENRGSVIWRIKRGILVSREGRDTGSLRLAVAAADGADGRCRVHVRMEVQNFYPWLRGTGPSARVGVWVYAQTQQRIHRTVTRGFLRRLATTAAEG